MRKIQWVILFFVIIALQAGCVLVEKKIKLKGSSMEPNFYAGQVFRVESISPADLKRGDIILYKNNELPNSYLQRVVGLPNETVEVHDGQVIINGEPLVEPYKVMAPSYTLNKISLGEGEYFVLGDNRDNSADSHLLGPVKWEQILGRAVPLD